MNIKQFPLRSFTPGRAGGYQPLVIVLHIEEGTLAGSRAWFTDPKNGVSAHYAVGRKGEVEQYVDIKNTAWHVGSVRSPRVELPYPANIKPNLYTVGIELEGKSGESIPEAQYLATLELVRDLLKQLPETKLSLRQRVIGHYQVNSIDRPNDPGPTFPWEQLYADLAPVPELKGPAVFLADVGAIIPAQIINGVTMVPIRPLVEALSLKAQYDNATQITTVRR